MKQTGWIMMKMQMINFIIEKIEKIHWITNIYKYPSEYVKVKLSSESGSYRFLFDHNQESNQMKMK